MHGILGNPKLESAQNASLPTGIERKCSRCGQTKFLFEFVKNAKCQYGYGGVCKVCARIRSRKWESENREQANEGRRKRYAKNPEKHRNRCRDWYSKNKEHEREMYKKQRDANPELMRENNRKWRAANPDKYKIIARRCTAKKRNTPKGRLDMNIHSKVWRSLKGEKCWRRWQDLVGYTIDQLKKHLEKQFLSGMTWDNYGSYWSVDHKIPVAAFNFERPEDIDFKKCWALKNLQPMEAKENRKKNDKLEIPFQSSLTI